MQEERKETRNPMNRTQHLDNPPLLIQAIDCPRPVVPASVCHPGHRSGAESRSYFTKRTQTDRQQRVVPAEPVLAQAGKPGSRNEQTNPN
jgi:hypothetical protein